jgi:hypothetical protein
MTTEKATVLLQLPAYRIDNSGGDRAALAAKAVVAEVKEMDLAAVELTDGKFAALWGGHGIIFADKAALLASEELNHLERATLKAKLE